MKKVLLLLCFTFCIFNSSFSQTNVYHPFPESGAVWNVHTYYYCGASIAYENNYYSYQFSGDTIIGSYTYHKLTIPYLYQAGPGTMCPLVTIGYKGCIRQDTALRKVFFVDPDSSNEELFYDFNLQIGDTINFGVNFIHFSLPYVVSNIDSVLIGNNYRKRWLCPGFQPATDYYFIEGIGCLSGPLEPAWNDISGDGMTFTLTCFQQNDTTLYYDTAHAITCDIIDAVKNLPEKNISSTLSPNPFHATATLKISWQLAASNWKMKIYDVLGKCIRTQPIFNQQSTIINRDGLVDGIYFYEVTRDEGRVTNGKFVVE